ncbi:MAG: DUF2341 domain-containing protein [Lentisphaerae bacterium]|nr:DUF2341 domain-containing protein [Lentisphaerota bacterium]
MCTNTWHAPQSPGEFSHKISGLSEDCLYYYRFMAKNDSGTSWAPQTSVFVTSEVWFEKGSDAYFTGLISGEVKVHRKDSVIDKPLDIYYSIGGTAIPHVEYVKLPGVVTIPIGETNATINIQPLPTTVMPKTKTLELELISSCIKGNPSMATVKIIGEDLDAWQKSMPITFSGYTKEEVLTNFPALVVFEEGLSRPGFSYDGFLSGPYGDLRFIDETETMLAFEVESWDTSGKSYVWVRVPELAQNTTIYALWGKADVEAPLSNTDGSVWHDGFAAVWHLNDMSGWDSSINREHGTLKGGITQDSDGAAGSALKFNGSNGYIDCGTGFNMIFKSATLSVWFKSNKLTALAGLIGKSAIGGNRRYSIFFESGYLYACFDVTGWVAPKTAWLDEYHDGTWHQITAVYDRQADLKLFVDGEYKSSASLASQASEEMITGVMFSMGRYASGYYYPGALDEARMMMEAVSDNWVWATYQNMRHNDTFNDYGEVALQTPTGSIYVFR